MAARIKTFADLHSVVGGRSNRTIYRGVLKADYRLIPKVGRIKHYTLRLERDILTLFKMHARPHIDREPADAVEWLALAQHHGLPTRLLDWTRNPLVAAYFALEKHSGDDSAIYIYEPRTVLDPESPIKDPFRIRGPSFMYSTHVTPRIAAQAAVFTIQPRPQVPLDERRKGIEKIVVAQSSREGLLATLFRYGVHRGALFPDLDGQASFIRWLKAGSYD